MKAVLLLFAIGLAITAPTVAADPIPDEPVDCLKNLAGCETTEEIIWAIRCIGDSLNGHHCTSP